MLPMDIWRTDKLLLFLIFFMPGFISITIYDLLIAGERRDFTKSLFEVMGYSALNFAALSWPIIIINSSNFYINHKFWYLICLTLIIFVFPIFWPILYTKLSNKQFFAKYILQLPPTAWDYVFRQKRGFWIIVHLKNGKKIGGIYGLSSYASAYPEEKELYLQEVWKLDKGGNFVEPIDRSKGMIIFKDEILSIELFQ
jgi:hypothetical protein